MAWNDMTFNDFETFVTTETGRIDSGRVVLDDANTDDRDVRLDAWRNMVFYTFAKPWNRRIVGVTEPPLPASDCGHGEEQI